MAEFRTITDLCGDRTPGWPTHCYCGGELYLVACGDEIHARCLAPCRICFEPDMFFGLVPRRHTATGSVAAIGVRFRDLTGDQPPGGCQPAELPGQEEATQVLADALGAAITERYGDG